MARAWFRYGPGGGSAASSGRRLGGGRLGHLHASRPAILGEPDLRLELRRPAAGEADRPAQAEVLERPEQVDRRLTRLPDVVVARVQRDPQGRRVATGLLAALAGDGDELGDPRRPDVDEVELVGELDGDPERDVLAVAARR